MTITRYVKVGDTGIPFSATLQDNMGTGVDLSGATVNFVMTPRRSTTPKVEAAATIDTPLGGEVSYISDTTDLDTEGVYLVEWRVDFGGGEIQRFPGDGYNQVIVKANLGTL